jgi:predicted  nucleic acid-binding Zn ribbon protein
MLWFLCPWCDHALVIADPIQDESSVRCDLCATVVDLATHRADEGAERLPFAA